MSGYLYHNIEYFWLLLVFFFINIFPLIIIVYILIYYIYIYIIFLVLKSTKLALGCRDIDDSTLDPTQSYLLVETQQEGGRRVKKGNGKIS